MSLSRFVPSFILMTLLTLPTLLGAQDAAPNKSATVGKVDRAGDPLPAGAVTRLGTTRFRHQSLVSFVGYSADGNLITVSGDALRVWDRAGKEVRRVEIKSNSRRLMYGQGPAVLLSGDGKTIVLGAGDADVTVIEVATGKTVREFKIPQTMPRNRYGPGGTQTHLSHNGRVLLLVNADEFGDGIPTKISAWDTTTGKLIRDFETKEKNEIFMAGSLSKDGITLITVEGQSRNNKPNDKGDKGPEKPRFRFVNLADGKETRSLPCPIDFIKEVTLTADAKYLIVRDRNNQGIRQLDAVTGKEVRGFNSNDKQGIAGALLAPDHKTLFINHFTRIIQHDLKSGNELRSIPIRNGSSEEFDNFGPYGRSSRLSFAITHDGKTLAVPAHGSVAFWDLLTGKEVPIDEGHRDRIDSVVFGPGGKQLLTGSADAGLFLWDLADGGKRVREFTQKTPDMPDERNRRYGGEKIELFRVRGEFSPDGKNIAGLWWGDKLHIWNAQSGKLQHHLGGPQGSSGFAFTPNGRFIALAGMDGSLGLWDIEKGREVRTFGPAAKARPMMDDDPPELEGFEQGAFMTTFSRDGRLLIHGGIKLEPRGLNVHIKYWELASGQERMKSSARIELSGPGVAFDSLTSALDTFLVAFVFSPDGKSILEAGFSNVKLRDVRTGTEIRAFGGTQVAAKTALFSPDGTMLIAGKYNGALRLWDIANGTVLLDFPAHLSQVTALGFSADGKWLASGAGDASVLIWDWEHIRKQALARKPAGTSPPAEALWTDLVNKDGLKVDRAVKALAAAPTQAVPFLKTRVRPVPAVAAKHLEKLLNDLNHSEYATRQKAEAALESLGDLAAAAIKDRRSRSPSVETARRLDALQLKLDNQVPSAEVLQALRGIEILELIDSAEAREVLDGLAKGAAGHRITEDARDALRRLAPKTAKTP